MSHAMREAHAEARYLGLPCPFDCAACNPEPVLTGITDVHLDCGHDTTAEHYADDAHGPLHPTGATYCWTCATVRTITATLPLLPVPLVPPTPGDPWTFTDDVAATTDVPF